MTIDVPTLAYVASVIDTQGIIRTRIAGDTELPMVAVHGPNIRVLNMLAELTGTKVTVVRRDYSRVGCAEHCQEKHQHITSSSGRWSVTGVKATVLLYNLRPFMRFQEEAARSALVLGQSTKFKPATIQKMVELGWEVPEFGTVRGEAC